MPQPTSKHHAEWLSLIEISGPFLSMPVLTRAFPQGLDELEDGQARSLRADFEFWQERVKGAKPDVAVHTAWIGLVLESLLGYSGDVLLKGQAISAGWKAEFPEHEETIRPDMMLVSPGTNKPLLLIQVFPPTQNLEKSVHGSRWQASAATRMMELLHATEVRLGLITNGEQWMLVNAPKGETTGFTTWYAGLWFDESVTLRAFRSLLGVQRFFGVADDLTLESLLKASANDQQEITDQLGLQVRHAVEILIQMIDRADQDRGGKLLGKEVSPSLLYEASLTVMMRLVFMLSAEERKLLPLDEPLYADNYAVTTLREQLAKVASDYGEEVLERRYDAWSRLLAVFRAVYRGIRHERLNLPPYGGSLFDPEKYPFLEGRKAVATENAEKKEIPLPVNNRTVLHLLDALQMIQMEGEARRLSFRALDVEQIGHVYEGLLDHVAVRASEPMLGLRGAKRLEPEVSLSELEKAASLKESDFIAWLNEITGRSAQALKNAVASDIIQKDADFANRLHSACGSNESLFARVKRFAGLIRMDDFGFPVVILAGSVYVTAGTTRRATGTHYTPRSLTEPVVQHTLEPLAYLGPAEGLPREEWKLRSPRELLDLKICDMAMGSGGFLVQVVRYLAERLVEAWRLDGGDWVADGDERLRSAVAGLSADDDRLTFARRLVAERCIYGVDKNPLAVEIAKLSLWLVTLAKDLPFTFLNHALKPGDSLVGASVDDFERWAHVIKDSTMLLWKDEVLKNLETARQKRRELEGFAVRDVQDAQRKEELLKEADAATERVRRGADLMTGARLLGLKAQELESLLDTLAMDYGAGLLFDTIDPAKHPDAARALAVAQKERAFHWEFAFPEVFARGGFSAFVGNPPFIGGQRLTGAFGTPYRDYLVEYLAKGKRGSADFCAYFFLKTYSLLRKKGSFGLIATNTIAQGDTREVGLDAIAKEGGVIYFANSSMPWPGMAAVFVSIVHAYKGNFVGRKYLDEKPVNQITALLDSSESIAKPYKLDSNAAKSFQGSIVLGMGFVLSSDEAKGLIEKNPKNKDVIFPYLVGEDLNSRPDQSSSRYVINFSDWSLEKAQEYPDCLSVVDSRVKPERDAYNPDKNSWNRTVKEKWWLFGAWRKNLETLIAPLKKVLVITIVSRTVAFVFVPTGTVFSHKLAVFPFDSFSHFSVLQSAFHYFWAWKYSSTMKSDLNYSPTDVFQTFPFPRDLSGLEQIGETYHETRRQIMLARQEGLTKIYNRFHDPDESAADIVELRRLHVEMDDAVAGAYGWADLSLGHDFHETAQGVRYTISESARRDVLSRLLKLNHERYEEEQRQVEKEIGKQGSKKAGKVKSPKSAPGDGQIGMF